MRFSEEQMISEILKRSEDLKRRKEQRSLRLCSAGFAFLAAALVLTITLVVGKGTSVSSSSHYGAFMLNAETGGYIAVAVIAFLVGIVFTVLVNKYRNSKRTNTES
ncbi:MAG: hypothetical protein IJM62_00115 [Lachnospiraceae bacterium]|nr:hypothetical protein [Lachnospiraceae bacterium]